MPFTRSSSAHNSTSKVPEICMNSACNAYTAEQNQSQLLRKYSRELAQLNAEIDNLNAQLAQSFEDAKRNGVEISFGLLPVGRISRILDSFSRSIKVAIRAAEASARRQGSYSPTHIPPINEVINFAIEVRRIQIMDRELARKVNQVQQLSEDYIMRDAEQKQDAERARQSYRANRCMQYLNEATAFTTPVFCENDRR